MKLKKIIYAWISKTFMDGCSNYNSLQVRKSCRSKKQARDKFKQGGIAHAQGMIFFNPFKAVKFAKKYGFPLVIKPNVSGFSRGSHFPINNYQQLWKAMFFAKCWWPFTVVEQYLQGHNYRVVVANGQIMSVLERYAPFVIGDGQSTIEQLIDVENNTREKMGLYPCMSPLQKGKQTTYFLKKSGYTLTSIPAVDENVTLFYRISLAPGGVVEVIEKTTLPEANQKLFKQVLALFDANILGIDVIMENGINQDHRDQKVIFLEVNSRPYLKMHNYPRYGKAEDLSAHFDALDKLEISQSDIY
ncbi:cyanophycin synthetase [Psychromonas sp. psych-6C06]|uniref:cyanophycin synthetase n=1 Tax=Psychromonas sp. psych-6C06 TaxID=2058089 RepID=UPI000C32E896|nr:cyanophycin synthetase [Psychromonas sp. psych-6C06]PKF60808.1 cyanophycin synthetase [Psychromonas sp. psych-6C06]